jgi:flagellar hook-associated protein 1 FlgK
MAFAAVTDAGLSGLYAASTQLSTSSHNISNASLDGYHRQVVVLEPRQPQPQNAFFIGTGVNVQSVKRVFDTFLDQQLREASSTGSFFDTLQLQTGQVDAALSSDQASLLPTLQSFFTALSGMAAAPTSTPARQLVVSNGSVMADRFASLQDRLNSIRRGVEDGISSAVTDLNSYAQLLARVNSLIQLSALDARGDPAPDLLDQRDSLVSEIAGLVNINVVYSSDGAATISVADGRALVEGTASRNIGTSFNPNFPAEKSVTVTVGGTTTFLRDESITGGKIGALLQVRNQTLNFADGQLGRLAVSITSAMNSQHRLGFDQSGNQGGALFKNQTDIGSATPSSLNNVNSTAAITGRVIDASTLTGLYYSIDFDGTQYRFTSTDGRTVVPTVIDDTGRVLAANETPINGNTHQYLLEGLQLTVSGVASAGDRFDLRPTAGKAGGMVLDADIQKDPRRIAAAGPRTDPVTSSPVSIATTQSKFVSSNPTIVGSAELVDKTLTGLAKVRSGTYTLTYHQDASGNFTGTVTRDGDLVVPVTVSADVNNRYYTFDGIKLTLPKGSPATVPGNRDTFRVDLTMTSDSLATGDGRNAQLLADIQRSAKAIAGANTLAEGYSQLAATVGVQAASAKTRNEAQTALVQQLKSQQQALSGVNLDEEAANLLRYQQAYQASSKLIAVAGKLLDSILAIN